MFGPFNLPFLMEFLYYEDIFMYASQRFKEAVPVTSFHKILKFFLNAFEHFLFALQTKSL